MRCAPQWRNPPALTPAIVNDQDLRLPQIHAYLLFVPTVNDSIRVLPALWQVSGPLGHASPAHCLPALLHRRRVKHAAAAVAAWCGAAAGLQAPQQGGGASLAGAALFHLGSGRGRRQHHAHRPEGRGRQPCGAQRENDLRIPRLHGSPSAIASFAPRAHSRSSNRCWRLLQASAEERWSIGQTKVTDDTWAAILRGNGSIIGALTFTQLYQVVSRTMRPRRTPLCSPGPVPCSPDTLAARCSLPSSADDRLRAGDPAVATRAALLPRATAAGDGRGLWRRPHGGRGASNRASFVAVPEAEHDPKRPARPRVRAAARRSRSSWSSPSSPPSSRSSWSCAWCAARWRAAARSLAASRRRACRRTRRSSSPTFTGGAAENSSSCLLANPLIVAPVLLGARNPADVLPSKLPPIMHFRPSGTGAEPG